MRAHEFLTELNMSPTRLQQFLSSPAAANIIAGFEVECCMPGDDGDDRDYEPDYDMDCTLPRNVDFDDIRQFFDLGDHALRSMRDDYEDYVNESFNDYLERNIDDAASRARQQSPDADDDEILETATEEITEIYYGGERPDLYDFLKNEDIHTYLDVSERYDFNWPHFIQSDPPPHEDIAFSLAGHLGVKAISNDSYGGRRPENTWVVEPDGSIEPDSGGYTGVEIISPPMPIKQCLEMLKKTLDFVSRNHGHTNDSTGLHVGVSIQGKDIEEVDYVKLAMFLGDKYVLEQFNRSSCNYARSTLDKLKDEVRYQPNDTIVAQFGAIKNGLLHDASKLLMDRNRDRRMTINMNDEYIEFRSMGDDYLDRYDVIERTIMRYAQAYAIASDPAANRKEYVKKLTKLINPTGIDKIQVFVQYAAGEIDKRKLVQHLNFQHRRGDMYTVDPRLAQPRIQASDPQSVLRGLPTVNPTTGETEHIPLTPGSDEWEQQHEALHAAYANRLARDN